MANHMALINHVETCMFLSVQPVCMCVLHACVHPHIEKKTQTVIYIHATVEVCTHVQLLSS